MNLNIYDFMSIPSEEERNNIYNYIPIINELRLVIDYEKRFNRDTWYIDEIDMCEELNSWLRQFNNRINELRMTYVMSKFYFDKGIPDDRWFDSETSKYFPDFKEEHFYIKYYFDYFSDIFYYKFFGIWDSIFHLINIFYQININEHNNKFKFKVRQALKLKCKELHDYIVEMEKTIDYKKANSLRNDLTHNFPSNEVDSGISRIRGMTIWHVGNYTKSQEFNENMEKVLVLLHKTIVFLKACFEEPIVKEA